MNNRSTCSECRSSGVGGRSFLIALFATWLLAWPGGESRGDITNGLAGHWTFEEGNGTTTADASTNGLTGTLAGSPLPTWVSPGKVGSGALDLPGDSATKVDLGNPAALQLTGAMTLTAWAWPDTVTGGGRIITKGGNSGARGWSLNVESTGVWRMQIAVNSTTLVSCGTAGGSVALGTWTHVAGVYDPSGTPSMKLYTNGVLAATQTSGVPGAQYNPATTGAAIGARSDGTTRWDGKLDEVRIYNRALTGAEIQSLPELPQIEPQPIVFLLQPTNQTIHAGDPVSFTTAVQGTPPYFVHWFSNSVEIAGENRLTYFIPAATTNMNGTVYAVSVSNLVYSATSSNAVLTVLENHPGLLSAGPVSPRLYRVYEIALAAVSPGALPYTNAGVTATFTHASGTNFTVRGFWDGANVWRLRFAPMLAGEWNWSTVSTDPGLHGVSSNFIAVASTAAEVATNQLLRGFLRRDGLAWRLSDGSMFLPVGDTQWSFAEELFPAEFQAWMDALRVRGLNTVHGTAWLAIYNRGGLSPFNGSPAGDNLNPAYFKRLDQMIQYANDQGIMVGLCIGGFPGNSAWWSKLNTQACDDRWFRYIVARYAALNLRWVLYGEVNEANPPWGTWQSEVSHKAVLVKAEDPYRHPIGCHHTTVDTASISDPNVDYLEVQSPTPRSETQYTDALGYRTYGKPVWFEEYWYEPAAYDNEYTLGIRNTYRNFIAALAFPTFGSLMRAHAGTADFPPTRAAQLGMSLLDYLLTQDNGLQRMQHFADFMRGLDTIAFSPEAARVNRGQCGRFGTTFAIFLQGGGNVNLDLADVTGEFLVRRLDINSGKFVSLGTITGGGVRSITSGTTADVSILVVPAAPRLHGAKLTTQNEFVFQLIGEDRRDFGIESTSDFETWNEVSRITTTNAQAEFRATLSADGSSRLFYRAVVIPNGQ